jgi:hypothetical protein
MEMQMRDELQAQIERLAGAAERLEQLVLQQGTIAASAEASIGRIVATVESQREMELMERLTIAERTIAELRASAVSAATAAYAPGSVTHGVRRTVPVGLQAKQEGGTGMEAGALDAALVSLSMEQRFAVKSQLLRAGLI